MSMVLDTRALTGFGEHLTRAAVVLPSRVGAVIRKTAFDIERDAKGAAPVDTGFLKGSISTTITGSGPEISAEVGPTAEYGIYQELGTSEMAAQPYLAPAFDRRAPELEKALLVLGVEVLR